MASPNNTRDSGPPQPPWTADDTWEVWQQFQLSTDLDRLLDSMANAAVIGFTGTHALPHEQMVELRRMGRRHLRDFCLEALEQMGDEARALDS